MNQNELLVAISNKKQTDYATALANGDTSFKVVTFNDFSVASHDATQIMDGDKLGKGHDFDTEQQLESIHTKRSFGFDANSLNLPWALGFALGSVATAEVEAAVAYSHVFKFSDRNTVASQNPVTSIKEIIGGFQSRLIPSLAVESVSLSGEFEKRIKLKVDLVGSGKITTSGITLTGSPFATAYFINQMCVLTLGPSGGALVDVAGRWHKWTLDIKNNLNEEQARYPGSGFNTTGDPYSGAVAGRMEYNRRVATLKLWLRTTAGSTEHAELLAGTLKGAKIVATGGNIPGTASANKYSFELDFPKLRWKTVEVENDGETIVLNLETTLFYDATNVGPMAATVQTDVPAFLN